MRITAVASAIAFAACGGAGSGDPSTSTPSPSVASERPTSTAELGITRPRNGERVGRDAELVIDLQGGRVVDQTSTDLQPDEGHLHVTLDGTLLTMTSALEQPLTDLEPGDHLVQVEFVANDHAPFDPRVLAAVAFESER